MMNRKVTIEWALSNPNVETDECLVALGAIEMLNPGDEFDIEPEAMAEAIGDALGWNPEWPRDVFPGAEGGVVVWPKWKAAAGLVLAAGPRADEI